MSDERREQNTDIDIIYAIALIVARGKRGHHPAIILIT